MIKIISGKYKNRILLSNSNKSRPSSKIVKESIFSTLTSGIFIQTKIFSIEKKVLDLFSGSGGLGFEALSRGAGSLTLVDIDKYCLQCARKFANELGIINSVKFLHLDACKLPKAYLKYDLVFLDPPYYKDYAHFSIESLVKHEWMNDGCILVLELSSKKNVLTNNQLKLLHILTHGNSKVLIFIYNKS